MASDSATFIRRDFYVNPPSSNASPEEWVKWERADARAAAIDKRAHTRGQKACQPLDAETSMRKVGGVWKQTTSISFAGDIENGGQLEPTIDAPQERELVINSFTGCHRGGKNISGNAKRAAKRMARKARKAARR